ncbi:ankyrin repeat domain-containing protein [Helicobacter sp. MIT 05-5293]|uniref:ankyrin repeat domain-containing protein n=1 Tax=Helicobacter sp. MIT 05-5293 TaxID=1548149 RepID=UPI00051D6332|nr:ankyrin repeat domain-containing protein [Helicobacter sp. MIT 05-5293]TLD80142.1 ankyrin repeat domain-containing protein [Helicobacter sp. MIT 05-5293]
MRDIYKAIKENNMALLIDFIKSGQDLNIINEHTFTPLQYAILKGNLGIALLLIECGARYDSKELIIFADKTGQNEISEALKLVI